ncbi:MAG: class I SAM-dependent methyltransferase [Gallionella sp.]
MSSPQSDKNFGGSIAKFYEEYIVPLIFEPYAEDLARRLATRRLARVLEIAAGTGVVTRRLASLLPEDVSIVATDLNQPMLDLASEAGTARRVEWRQADAMQLPFEDGSFDAVVCQFGVMFFPDKAKAFAEARRVLSSGGVLLFNVWDRIEENEFADVITTALESVFPDDPPRFLARLPRHRNHRARSAGRRLCHDTIRGYPGCEKHRRVGQDTRNGVLPGNTAAQRDRGAGQVQARRSDRHRRERHRQTVWTRASCRQDPGTHCHGGMLME